MCPTTLCGLSVAAVAIVCIAAIVASATAFAIASLAIACSLAIFFLNCSSILLYVCLSETLTTNNMQLTLIALRDTNWIRELNKVAIYPACTNSLQKVAVLAALILGPTLLGC